MRCPSCNYSLVLLEKRRKYRCPRCSRLYSQKEIELKDFVDFNKRERKKDKEDLNEKKDKQKPLSEFEKNQRRMDYNKKWMEDNQEKIKEYKLKNKQACQKYYERNKEKFLIKNRKYRKENGQAIKQRRKNRRLRNIEEMRTLTRIGSLRLKQKQLAQQFFEFEDIRAYKDEYQDSLPTLLLS
jgi:hypothetical protein